MESDYDNALMKRKYNSYHQDVKNKKKINSIDRGIIDNQTALDLAES